MPGQQNVSRHGGEFKLNAVAISQPPGVQVKDVAESLCHHPFMLSKWRKQVQDGILVSTADLPDPVSLAELKRLREWETKYQRLQTEHDLLGKVCKTSWRPEWRSATG